MGLIKNIQINYYNKIFDQLLIDKNFNQIIKELAILKQNKRDLYNLFAPKYVNTILNNFDYKAPLKKNVIWLNTFHAPDMEIIISFLKFYLPLASSVNFEYYSFPNLIINFLNDFKLDNKNITFDSFLDLNDQIQYYLNSDYPSDKFVFNSNVFYEQIDKNRYFTYTSICSAFFYLVRSPFQIYQDLIVQSNKTEALNKVLFSDQRNSFFNNGDVKIEENTQSWETHVNSWTNDNVINTFNGHLIRFEEISKNSLQVFAEIIAHLNMAGYDIELDYDKITSFINENKGHIAFLPQNELNISNKTKKLFEGQLDNVTKKFNYMI